MPGLYIIFNRGLQSTLGSLVLPSQQYPCVGTKFPMPLLYWLSLIISFYIVFCYFSLCPCCFILFKNTFIITLAEFEEHRLKKNLQNFYQQYLQ